MVRDTGGKEPSSKGKQPLSTDVSKDEELWSAPWLGWNGKLEQLGEYDIQQAGATGSSGYQAKAQQACSQTLCRLMV